MRIFPLLSLGVDGFKYPSSFCHLQDKGGVFKATPPLPPYRRMDPESEDVSSDLALGTHPLDHASLVVG